MVICNLHLTHRHDYSLLSCLSLAVCWWHSAVHCIKSIRSIVWHHGILQSWFCFSRMALNQDKSDALLLGTCQQSRCYASLCSVKVAGCSVSLSDYIKILGVILDSHLSLNKHINSICKFAYYHIRSLRHIRSAITDDMAKSVASSLVCSHLEYANSLLYGTTSKMSIGYSASKTHLPVIASHALPQDTHTSGILKYLCWLPIEQHIKFKLATLTHYTLCSTQSAYLHSLLNFHTPTRSLHSANANLLSVPRVCTTFASHTFSVAAPIVWNSLTFGIRDSSSTHTFHRVLKTYCFQQAFGSL